VLKIEKESGGKEEWEEGREIRSRVEYGRKNKRNERRRELLGGRKSVMKRR
jgi:hypothetical protein